MTDSDTGEKLRFVFDDAPVWEGSARGYQRELPVVRADQPYQPGNVLLTFYNYLVTFR